MAVKFLATLRMAEPDLGLACYGFEYGYGSHLAPAASSHRRRCGDEDRPQEARDAFPPELRTTRSAHGAARFATSV
jgi:hypothetical protein